ncbi:MAG: hypothetical protein J5382_01685 [Bacteroidales bacterium]|nr:hypothetical protein [Bacteroidales bacterium]
MPERIQIVLDADVIIHFAQGGYLHLLPKVVPECSFVVLSVVRDELRQETKNVLDNHIYHLKNISLIEFNPMGEERREFARLTSLSGLCLGKGESACMTYARFRHNVVGSSNLKDIRDYCAEFGIAYLTTWDFLYYAFKAGLMMKEEIGEFVQKVRAAGSILPDMDIETYFCGVF